MKKLQKLTLKEMNNEMVVISHNELPMLIGGGSDFSFDPDSFCPDWADDLADMAHNMLEYGTTTIDATVKAVENAASAVADAASYAVSNAGDLAVDIAEEAITGLADWSAGGTSPLGAPFLVIPSLIPTPLNNPYNAPQ